MLFQLENLFSIFYIYSKNIIHFEDAKANMLNDFFVLSFKFELESVVSKLAMTAILGVKY